MSVRRLVAVVVVAMLAVVPSVRGQTIELPSRIEAGTSLADALETIRDAGARLLFSDSLVPPGLEVTAAPRTDQLLELLTALLDPHGLTVISGAGGTLVVVATDQAEVRGELLGVVRSRDAERPVPGVEIRVAGEQAVTDDDGAFRFTLPPGRHQIEARRPGFVIARIDGIEIPPAGVAETTVWLDAAPILEDELTVKPSRVSLLRDEPRSPIALSRDDIQALPHLGGDFFRSLSLLPGIASNDVTAEFHVRGGRRDETQILLDGQELYESYHLKDFDNALSVVPPATLESVDLATGGFSVEHGDRMSGVLDMTTSDRRGPVRRYVGLSLLNLEAGGDGAAGERNRWMLQARRGSIDLASRLLGKEDPVYWDAFGKFAHDLSDGSGLRLHQLHSSDELEIMERVDDESKRIETDYSSNYLWLTHHALGGRRWLAETVLSASDIRRDRFGDEDEEDVAFVVRDRRELEVFALKQDWTLALDRGQSVRWGLHLRRFDVAYGYRSSYEFGTPLAAVRDGGEAGDVDFDRRFEEEDVGVYLLDRWRPTDAWTLELGLRWDQHSLADEDLWSPRINVARAIGETAVLRLAIGRFNQSQRPYELQVADGATDFAPVERSDRALVGYERRFPRAGNLALRFEVYHHVVDNPRPRYENLYEPVNTFPELEPDRVLVEPERSVAQGAEIFVRGGGGPRFDWWVNYTYATSEDEIAGVDVPRRFDQPHSANLDLDLRLTPRWTLNLAGRYHTGWPTTPLMVDVSVDDDGEIEFTPRLGRRFSSRLPDYHRLDLRLSRRWSAGPRDFVFFVDVQNVYDRGNIAGFDFDFDEETGEVLPNAEEWAPLLPSAGIKVRW